jgi:pyruvate/2-oxoacid:ferredoxin oxidoreductase beta subunit
MEQQKLAVESGYWPLYRYDPRLRAEGKNPFQLDSKAPKIRFRDYALNETRYRMLAQSDPQTSECCCRGRSVDRPALERAGISRGRAGVGMRRCGMPAE